MSQKYRIRILAPTDCWVADIDGDPGRTLVLENAKVFSGKPVATVAELGRKYPRRAFSVEWIQDETADVRGFRYQRT